MSDCGGTKRNMLPAIPEVVAGDKMPLSGLVPIQSNHRYRQLCHINNLKLQQRSQKNAVINIRNEREESASSGRSKEIWIDCDPTKASDNLKAKTKCVQQVSGAADPHLPSKKRSSYGYMDSHKANMINSWVENQSGPVEINQGQPNPEIGTKEPLGYGHDVSNLPKQSNSSSNLDNPLNQPEFRCLTQFKTIDTSDDGGGSSVMSCENQDQVKVQIHQPQQPMTTGGESPACISYLESDTKNVSDKLSNKPTPPPPPPRKTLPLSFNREYNGSKTSLEVGQTLSSVQTIDTNKTTEENLVANEDLPKKTRARKPSAENMLYRDQRQSYHEDELLENHPLRVLSESNLTVVSSFGGSLNNVNVEDDAENGEVIAANLSFFKLPEMPDDNSCQIGAFDDNIIDQRFKEFERLHNQGNNFITNNEYSKSQEAIFSANKPVLSTFAAKSAEANDHKVVEVSEYTALNETRESNVSNLYCEPFNPNLDNRNAETHSSSFVQNAFRFEDHSLDNVQKLPSPNFRHNLPARSLQPDPDGSSNPEINFAGRDNRQSSQLVATNSSVDSVGNSGWSANVCYDNCKISKSSSGNNNSNILVENSRKSPNNNTNIGTEVNTSMKNSNIIEREEDIEIKESFGSRFLRLFGSKRKKNGKKRSKSCETNAESSNKYKPISGSSVAPIATNPKVKFLVDSERHSRRSASASPDMLMTAGRKFNIQNNKNPDSLGTRFIHETGSYNFVNKLDLDISSGSNSQNTTGSSDAKGANHFGMYYEHERRIWEDGIDAQQEQIETNFNHIMIQKHPQSIFYGGNCNDNKRPRNKHRKSSGYDSLDGDEESSSMDSAGSNQNKLCQIVQGQNIHAISWDSNADNEQKVLHLNNLNEKNRIKNGPTKSSSGGVLKRLLSKSSSTSFAKASIAEEDIDSHEGKIVLQDQNDEFRRSSLVDKITKTTEISKAHITKPLNMEILQYDEMDILRMDFRSKQVSSTASTTNDSHSSTYSSTHS